MATKRCQVGGAMAGKCETIARAGFQASWSDATLCSRCAGRTVYATMFSEANGQHLGPRRPALSNLTWYDSLLVAREHPVVSVITLTATGLLCYAGHVTNYYAKTLEWFLGLPTALRDKHWFLIKRRQSLGKAAGHTTQKKPTTANGVRLIAAIIDVMKNMPNVYKGSKLVLEELSKYPLGREVEMLEQEDSVN